MSSPRRLNRAFTLVEVLVVIGIMAVLIGILLTAVEKARHRAYISACSNNLRQIGLAIQAYTNTSRGYYPRTLYVPGAPLTYGTGAASNDPFTPPTSGPPSNSGVQPNDCTAPYWLLARTQRLPTSIFICPYNDETSFSPDTADPQKTGNFTNWRTGLGYSYANPYPEAAVEAAGYRLTNKLPATFAIASDLNPGKTKRTDPTLAVPGAPKSVMEKANSLNHELDGQNVLYADGHVTWQLNPLCGHNNDNIFTNTNNQIEASPKAPLDSIMLPTGDD
jgi:prepilin-type N-terminal cleavage/methylation domain-containing protein/prepilin-type processing-associated H-X9-DG protein